MIYDRRRQKAFSTLDVEKQVSLFAEHFISAGPGGSIALGRDEFARMASKAAQFYKSVVKVHWGATFA
jgi:hypothetical protein